VVEGLTEALNNNPIYKLGKNLLGFESGGIVSGPDSGYPVILHGTERVTPIDNNSTRGGGGEQPIQINLRLDLDGQKFQDFTINVLKTNPVAQWEVQRISKAS